MSSKVFTPALEKIPNLDTLWVPCGYLIDPPLLVALLGRLGERLTAIYSESPFEDNDYSRMFLTADDLGRLRQKVLFPYPGSVYRNCLGTSCWVPLLRFESRMSLA